jgi:hypothetical protein
MKSTTLLFILLGIAGAMGAAILLSRFLLKPRGVPKTVVESAAPFDPYVSSIEELEAIKRAHALEQADSKRVYITISHTLRSFFGAMLNVHALEMTTSEIRRYLKRNRSSLVQTNHFVNLLSRSDMVKFAKDSPPKKRVEQDIDQSITMIKEIHNGSSGVQEEKGGGSDGI